MKKMPLSTLFPKDSFSNFKKKIGKRPASAKSGGRGKAPKKPALVGVKNDEQERAYFVKGDKVVYGIRKERKQDRVTVKGKRVNNWFASREEAFRALVAAVLRQKTKKPEKKAKKPVVGWFIKDGKPTLGTRKDRKQEKITVNGKRVNNWFESFKAVTAAKREMTVPAKKVCKKKACAKKPCTNNCCCVAKQAPVSVRRGKELTPSKKEIKAAVEKVLSKNKAVPSSKRQTSLTGWLVSDGQVLKGTYVKHDKVYVWFNTPIGIVKTLNWYRTRDGAKSSIRKKK